jgi:uncharacterized RDD family membrane protein YckC
MICRNHVEVSEGVRRCTRCGGTFCSNCLVDIGDHPFCADCKTQQLLDARSGVDRTLLNYGSVLKRFGAMLLDNLILCVPNVAVILVILAATGSFENPDAASGWMQLANIPTFAFAIAYEALMLILKNGQTVGKMAVGVRVVRPDGSPITNGQAWGRAAMRTVLSCLLIVDYLPAFFTDEKTTLHDLIAGTRVVDVY